MSYTQIPATFLTLEVPPTIALTQETSDAVLGYFGLDFMDSHSHWERLETLEGSLSCHVVVLW